MWVASCYHVHLLPSAREAVGGVGGVGYAGLQLCVLACYGLSLGLHGGRVGLVPSAALFMETRISDRKIGICCKIDFT